MSGGYFQPFHPGLPNRPIPPYPGFGGPRYNPVYDGMYAHNTTTVPYLNSLFETNNTTQSLIFRDAGMRHAYDSAYAASGPMAYANNVINPMMAQASQIYRDAMGHGGGGGGSHGGGNAAGHSGGLGSAAKHAVGGAVLGAAIGNFIPIPGVGAGIGAAIGGGIGFLSGLF
jgi:hypothetical protein